MMSPEQSLLTLSPASPSDFMLNAQSPLLVNGQKRPWCQRTFSPLSSGSLRAAVFTLISSATGAGLLSIPYAVYNCGLLCGSLLVILGGLTFCYFYKIIVSALIETKKRTLMQLVGSYYGQVMFRQGAKYFFIICLALNLFGIMCVCMVRINQIIMTTFILDFLSMFDLVTKANIEMLRMCITGAIILFLVTPMVIPKQISSLRYISTASLLAIAYVTIVIVVQSPQYFVHDDIKLSDIKLIQFDIGIADAVSIIVFSFNGITAVPMVFTSLNQNTYRRMSKIVNYSVGVCSVLYLLLGVFGYLSYMKDMPKLFIQRKSILGAVDWPMIIGKLFLCITLLGATVLNNSPLRQEILRILRVKNNKNTAYNIVTGTIMLCLAVVAIFIPDATAYFKFLGGISAVPLSILMPTMIYWKTADSCWKLVLLSTWSTILFVLGLISAVGVFIFPS